VLSRTSTTFDFFTMPRSIASAVQARDGKERDLGVYCSEDGGPPASSGLAAAQAELIGAMGNGRRQCERHEGLHSPEQVLTNFAEAEVVLKNHLTFDRNTFTGRPGKTDVLTLAFLRLHMLDDEDPPQNPTEVKGPLKENDEDYDSRLAEYRLKRRDYTAMMCHFIMMHYIGKKLRGRVNERLNLDGLEVARLGEAKHYMALKRILTSRPFTLVASLRADVLEDGDNLEALAMTEVGCTRKLLGQMREQTTRVVEHVFGQDPATFDPCDDSKQFSAQFLHDCAKLLVLKINLDCNVSAQALQLMRENAIAVVDTVVAHGEEDEVDLGVAQFEQHKRVLNYTTVMTPLVAALLDTEVYAGARSALAKRRASGRSGRGGSFGRGGGERTSNRTDVVDSAAVETEDVPPAQKKPKGPKKAKAARKKKAKRKAVEAAAYAAWSKDRGQTPLPNGRSFKCFNCGGDHRIATCTKPLIDCCTTCGQRHGDGSKCTQFFIAKYQRYLKTK
jgi:hypothetical protein